MSTPFPLEEQSQLERAEPTWDPWKGQPAPTTFQGMGFSEDTAYLGPFYRVLEAAGSGAAKGASVLTGLWHSEYAGLASLGVPGAREMATETSDAQQDARERVKAMTPDPATTGSAVQMLHGVGEGAYLLTAGSLLGGPLAGAATVGGTEGGSRYKELREQGVGQGTAAASGALTALTTGGGALLPAAYGSTLATRLLTGAASNTALGVGNRYADHKILEAGGYPEMAEQQKALDGTQMLVDAALGATFGGIHHLQASAEGRAAAALQTPATQDAALTANLALRDRAAAPGVPTDPAAAAAHQAAMEKASSDLLQGKPVDVSGTGVDQASFLSRPSFQDPTIAKVMTDSLKESGFLDEEATLADLEAQAEARMSGVKLAPRESTNETPAAKSVAPDEAPGGRFEVGQEWQKEGQAYQVMQVSADGKRARVDFGDGRPLWVHHDTEVDNGWEQRTDESPASVKPAAAAESPAYSIQEEPLTDDQVKAFQGLRSEVPANEKLDSTGVGESGEPRPEYAGRPGANAGEPLRVFRGADRDLAPEHFDLESLGRATGHPSSGLGVFFSLSKDEAAHYGEVTEHHLDIRNPKVIKAEDLPGFNSLEEAHAYREQLRKEGYDGMVIDGSHLGGPVNHVAFEPHQAIPAPSEHAAPSGDPVQQALAEHPGLQIADENGQPVKAADELAQTDASAKQDENDWFTATKAATDCFGRKGS